MHGAAIWKHTHLFFLAIVCQALWTWLSAGLYVFPWTSLLSVCVRVTMRGCPQGSRASFHMRHKKNYARSSFLLFVFYSRSRAHSTAFSFVWRTPNAVQVSCTVENEKKSQCRFPRIYFMTVDYITFGRSLVLDKQQCQHYVNLRPFPLTDIRNNTILPQ